MLCERAGELRSKFDFIYLVDRLFVLDSETVSLSRSTCFEGTRLLIERWPQIFLIDGYCLCCELTSAIESCVSCGSLRLSF